MNREYPSVALERAVGEFSKLPGIGRKTALRLVLHMLSRPEEEVSSFGHVFSTLKQDIRYCKVCHNISDSDVCDICANPKRDGSLLCVVENVQDVLAIESTMQYNGLYHVLGGIISPMDGIGPQDLQIASLVERLQEGEIKEVILALSPTSFPLTSILLTALPLMVIWPFSSNPTPGRDLMIPSTDSSDIPDISMSMLDWESTTLILGMVVPALAGSSFL